METLLFILDAVAVVVLVYTGLKNDQRRPGEKMIGPFSYTEAGRDHGDGET